MSAWDVSTCCGSLPGKRELARVEANALGKRGGWSGRKVPFAGKPLLSASGSFTDQRAMEARFARIG